MLNREILFNEVNETRDEYLTRAAKMLDSINKGVIKMGPVDLQHFKNIIGEVMMPDILEAVEHCRAMGMINDIEEDFLQNLSLKIFAKFPDFNNSKTTSYGETFKFSTFVNLYIDDAIRLTRAKERGYGPRMDRKRRKIAKAIAMAAHELNKKEADVTLNEIFLYMPKVTKNPITLREIEITLKASQPVYYIDENDEDTEKGIEDEIVIEEESIRNEFLKFVNCFRPVQQYLFLQGIGFCAEEYDDVHTKQLACDPKFVAMCKEDEIGIKHIMKGEFRIDRLKVGSKYLDGVNYENIEYVEERYIRDEKGRMNNRFRKMISEGDYSEQEIIANLVPILNELRDKIAKRYGV